VKRPPAVHLKRSLALLESAKRNSDSVSIRWRAGGPASWIEANPRWRVLKERVWLEFRSGEIVRRMQIEAVTAKPWGIQILLRDPKRPAGEALDFEWQPSAQEAVSGGARLWDIVRHWLSSKFPAHRVVKAVKRSDRAQTLSGSFLRVRFRHGGKERFLIAADRDAGEDMHRIVSQALLWILALNSRILAKSAPLVYFLVPAGCRPVPMHRCRHLSRKRVKAEIWEYEDQGADGLEIRRAVKPPAPEENRDYRWPVLGPFRWSPLLERVLNLAPDLIRRYPRFQDYDSLRLWGLEFAQVLGPERDRVCFGIGPQRTELTEENFGSLESLVREIVYYRRPDSPDILHPCYRLQAERWMEALILEDVARVFPEMAPESVYSQIPAYLGKDPGRIDILGADRRGTLVVMELKVYPDPDLPLQALDYWGRVIRHSRNGDFTRRGYFSEVRLNRQRPRIYLVAPVFSFHDSTEKLLRYFDPDLEIWKIAVNVDWRCGIKLLQRVRCRCGNQG
jgi:hypothetical protein